MARTTKPKPKSKDKDYNGPFPLAEDPDFLKLNPKQQKFVYNMFLQPISKWSNGKCYSDAYNQKKMDIAKANAHDLVITNRYVSICIDKLRKLYRENLAFEAEDTLSRMGKLSQSDITDFFTRDGKLITNPNEWPEEIKPCVSGFQVINIDPNTGKPTSYKITLWSKLEAEKIGTQVAGTNSPKKIELTGPGGGPIQINWKQEALELAEEILIEEEELE